MIGKLYNLVAITAVATLISTSGFVGVLYGTGKLTDARWNLILDVLRGKHDDLTQPAPTSQPASQPAAVEGQTPASAEESTKVIRDQRVMSQLQRANIERAARDVTARQTLLNQSVQQLISMQESHEREKTAFAEQQTRAGNKQRDEGFQRELAYVTGLSPKMAKDHLVRTWAKQKADVVRIFTALDPNKGKRILEQFKTAEELAIVHELLELIRTAQPEKPTLRSGKTTENEKP
ncbi:MAG: hypothetical protein JNG88_12540 [Phycisphaerales bacterium]|nr:hypothetical protein [Phycisphaerales bacterium]